jgi:AcrR family transcriptional regulator
MKIKNKAIEETVLLCTEKLLIEQGIKGWNMDTVAAEAGMAKNTLYKIIGTKEQLVEQIVIARLRGNVEAIVEIFTNEPDFVKAAETGARYLSHGIGEYDHFVLPKIFLEYPDIKKKFDAISGRLGGSIHTYLNKAKKSGIIRKDIDNDILIGSVTAVINHFMSVNYKGGKFEKSVYTALTYLLKGILK